MNRIATAIPHAACSASGGGAGTGVTVKGTKQTGSMLGVRTASKFFADSALETPGRIVAILVPRAFKFLWKFLWNYLCNDLRP